MALEENTTKQIGQQQISHGTTLFAEPIYQNKNFTITNALLTSWVAVIFNNHFIFYYSF